MELNSWASQNNHLKKSIESHFTIWSFMDRTYKYLVAAKGASATFVSIHQQSYYIPFHSNSETSEEKI